MTPRPNLAPVFLRIRYGVLTLLCTAVLAAAFHHRPPLLLGAAILAGAAVAMAQLRHLRLALLVALAPLPGLLWSAPDIYGFAFALAALMAAELAARLLKGGSEEESFAALFRPVPALLGAVLVGLCWSLWSRTGPQGIILASLSVLLALPAGVIFLPFGEYFHIAANRAQERRGPAAEAAARLAEPRWSFSLCGVALVFAVLGLFQIAQRPPPTDWIVCLLIAVVLQVATLDWRAAVAGLASTALLLLYAGAMNDSLLLFVLFALFLAQGTRPYRDSSRRIAWARAIEDQAVAVFFAGLGASLASGLLGGFVAGLDAGAALVVALFFFPALNLTLQYFLPSRQSLERMYKN